MGKSLEKAALETKSGREELWQAMSSVKESNEQALKEVESLRLRTQHMELQRFGQALESARLALRTGPERLCCL